MGLLWFSNSAPWHPVMLYQVVLERVYLGVLLSVVRGVVAVVVGDGGRAVVLVFGGMRVEDIH